MSLVKHTFKLKDGTIKESPHWYYRFEYNGKREFGSTGTANKKQAEAKEKQVREELFNKYELGVIESITLKKAIANYLAAVKDSGQHTDKITYTNKLLGSKVDPHSPTRDVVKIFGFDGDWNFEKITNSSVSQLVLCRKAEGNKSGTILGELSVLSQMMQINKQLNVPVPNINFKEIKKLNNLKPSKGKLRFLSVKEDTALLAELHPNRVMNGLFGEAPETTIRQRQDAYDFVVLLIDLGGRYSEIATLTWDDIDLKERTVGIYRNKVKNQSVLHMTKRVYEVLLRRYNDENKDDKHVFTAKDGGPKKYSSRAFDSACRRAGIEGVSIHTCRHTFGSRLAQRGCSIQEIQQLMGHQKITTTMIYAHLIPNQAAKKAAQLLEPLEA